MPTARTLLLLFLLQLIGCAKPPSDQDLIDTLTRERQSFERLVQIQLQGQSHVKMVPTGAYSFDENDSTKTMRPIMKPDPNQKPDPRDEKLRSEKQALMKKLHIKSVDLGPRGVSFYYTEMEDPLWGFNKGWQFIAEGDDQPDSTRVVGSLDGAKDMQPYERRYRSLGDGWYLFLDSTNSN